MHDENQCTNFYTSCESFFYPIFIRVKMHIERQFINFFNWRKSVWTQYSAQIACTSSASTRISYLARVMFRANSYYRLYVGRQYKNFFRLHQSCFEAIFGTHRLQYTNFFSWRDSCFQSVFITDKLYVECQITNFFRWRKSSLETIFITHSLHVEC
jgi:hypothetical protein